MLAIFRGIMIWTTVVVLVFFGVITVQQNADTVVQFEAKGMHAFGINWTEILEHISLRDLNNKWKEANVTEELHYAVERYKSIYKVSFEVRFLTRTVHSAPPATPGQKNVSLTSVDKNLIATQKPDGLCVMGEQVKSQYLYFNGPIIQQQPVLHRDIFFTHSGHYGAIHSLVNENLKMMSFVTENYALSTFVTYGNYGSEKTLTLVFGAKDQLPSLKGPFSYSNLIHASNLDHSLGIVTSYDNFASFSPLFYPNLTAVFKNAVSETLHVYLHNLIAKIVNLEVSGECKVTTFDTAIIVTLFEHNIAHYKFLYDVSKAPPCIDLNWLVDSLHSLYILQESIVTCYKNTTVKGLRVAGIEVVSTALAATTNAKAVSALGREKQDKWLKLVMMGITKENAYATDLLDAVIPGVVQVALSLYNSHDPLKPLTNQELYILSLTSFIIRKYKVHSQNGVALRLYYLLLTCFCSSLEMARMLDSMAIAYAAEYDGASWRSATDGEGLMGSGDFLPPCLTALRFDFTKKKLETHASQTSNYGQVELHAAVRGFLTKKEMLTTPHFENVLPASKCVSNKSEVLMYIPLENVTYIITKQKDVTGNIMYEILSTFLKNEMYVYVVAGSSCPTAAVRDSMDIPAVYNMTTSRSCALCGSIVMTYDEHAGLESILYITTHEIQERVFKSGTDYFDFDNMHTHYLLLMGNGTILEIRGVYKKRAVTALVFILYFIALVVAMYIGYKILMYSL